MNKAIHSSSHSFWLITLFVSALAVRALHLFAVGVLPAGDTPYYDAIAKGWAQTHFQDFLHTDNMYLGSFDIRFAYPFLMALLYLAFGLGNHLAVVIFQILLDSVLAVGIFYLCARFEKASTGLLAAAYYILLWENFRWTAYVLTDAVFIFNLFLLFAFSLSILRDFRLIKAVGFGLLLSWTLLTRANAIFLFFALPIYLAFHFKQSKKRAAAFLGMTIATAIIGISPFISIARSLPPPGIPAEGIGAPRRTLNETLIYSTKTIQDGLVFPRFLHTETDFITYLKKYPFAYPGLMFSKFIALYNPIAGNFSWRHNLLNLISLLPLYLFTIIGFVRTRGGPFHMILAIFIGSLTLVPILTWVDYDQRFRAYLIPFMAIMAAEGFHVTVDFFRGFRKQSSA